MNFQIFILVTFLIFSSITTVKCQDSISTKKASSWNLALDGMLGVSVGNNFYSANVGGPSFFLVINKNLKIGIGALPSIYLLDGKLGARLGVSPRIDYKNLVFIAPFFHKERTDEWIWSLGVGYKFHKKHKN